VTTTVSEQTPLTTTVGSDGVWRQALDATEASMTPHTITITGSDTSKIVLEEVLFGEVRMSPMESDSVCTLTSRHGLQTLQHGH
jgi:hypothetical protein